VPVAGRHPRIFPPPTVHAIFVALFIESTDMTSPSASEKALKTLFLQAPSFDGFDGGAGSRYQAKREIKSFWFPTWLAQSAALVPNSRLLDAPADELTVDESREIARGYDLVISSESGPAKGVITSSGTVHVTYCHSPMRYIWDMYHEYTNAEDMKGLTRFVFKAVAHYLRMWDLASAFRVDHFIANSNNTSARIWNLRCACLRSACRLRSSVMTALISPQLSRLFWRSAYGLDMQPRRSLMPLLLLDTLASIQMWTPLEARGEA